MERIPVQIRRLRHKRGWTQLDLANKTGLHAPNISMWEDPEYHCNSKIETLRRFATAFGLELSVNFVPKGQGNA